MIKKINQYPYPYVQMALISQENQGNVPNSDLTLDHKRDEGGFNWKETKEGYDFWRAVSCDLEPKVTDEIMDNYPSDLFEVSENYDYIWCFKDDEWFETILLAKLSESIVKPYCVVDKGSLVNYLNGLDEIKTEMYKSSEISFTNPYSDDFDESIRITMDEGIKILEEHGYKIL